MKIVHVIESLDPDGGGPAVSVPSLACAQAAAGEAVTLISYRLSAEAHDTASSSIGAFEMLELLSVGKGWDAKRILCGSIGETKIGQAIAAANFVHVHGVWHPFLAAAAKEARRHGIGYAVAPRGMLDPWSLSQKRLKKAIALWAYVRDMLKGAKFIHVLNTDEGELLRPLGLGVPLEVLPNGVYVKDIEDHACRSVSSELNAKLAGRRFVLFLGRLHYKKGIDVLMEAFRRIADMDKDLCLLLAGPDCGVGADIDEVSRKYGISERVIKCGPIYGTAKYAAYAAAECFCLPSRQEGFSMAILEALASGTPVVISEHCHFSEIAHAGAGQVVPLNPDAIAEAIMTYASDRKARDAAGSAGKALVRRKYEWSEIAERSLLLYKI